MTQIRVSLPEGFANGQALATSLGLDPSPLAGCVVVEGDELVVNGDVTEQQVTAALAAHDSSPQPRSLDRIGALATLLAVEEVVTVADAANAVSLTEQNLIDEAMAWSVGNP